MALVYGMDLLRPSSYHSIRPQSPVGSNPWLCKTTPTSPKSINNFTRRSRNCKRMKFTPLAIAQPLTSSSQANTSTEVEVKEDENKFNWFEQWYPAAPEYDLDKRVPHAFTVLGLDIVVWWDKKEEAWRVFDDSCPHRRAPLSEGRIDEDGDLQCSYHGWCFGSKGECKYIPQAPSDGPPLPYSGATYLGDIWTRYDLLLHNQSFRSQDQLICMHFGPRRLYLHSSVHTSKRACARVYPSLQQQGIIWFWPNTDPLFKDIALEKKPPLIPVLSDPSFPSTLSMRDVPYGYEILTENLLDASHVPYAHHGLIAQTDAGSTKSGSMKSDQRAGRPLNLRLQNLDKSGFQGEQEQGSLSFAAPCVIISDFTFKPKKGMIQTSISGAEEEKMRTIFLIFICVPVSPGRSRLIWAFPRNFALWANLLLPRWLTHINENLFLDSDLCLLHLEEHKLQEYGQRNWEKACYMPTTADVFVVAFRKWLKQYASIGFPWGEKHFNGSLPPTPPKAQLMDRYWSHVVKCRSCKGALKVFKALEITTQVLSVVSVAILGVIAIIKHTPFSSINVWNPILVSSALVFCLTSRWLSHFIYKTFYFHDYNHALVK